MDIDTACVAIAADIATHGHAIRPGFVAREELAPLREHLMAWWEEGELRRAGIGRGESWQLREDIRGDYVRWIDFSTPGPFSEFLAVTTNRCAWPAIASCCSACTNTRAM